MATTAAPRKSQGARQVVLPAAAALQSAARTLDLECEGLHALRDALQQQLRHAFGKAVATLAAAKGRVIVTGWPVWATASTIDVHFALNLEIGIFSIPAS